MSAIPSQNANLPTKAMNLFDLLINHLIDGTEQQSRDARFLSQTTRVIAPSVSSVTTSITGTCPTSSSGTSLTKKCTRPETEDEYDFQSNTFASSKSISGEPSNKISATQAIMDFESVEPSDESADVATTTLDKMLRSGSTNSQQAINSPSPSSFLQVRCCDEAHSPAQERQVAGRDPSQSTLTEQRATLTTKRLAGGIDGCEVTFCTKNEDGNPLVIRAVCPNFEPRRVWFNGKPFDYIDSESEHPIMGSEFDFNDGHYEHYHSDIEEEDEPGSYDDTTILEDDSEEF